ncbi:2-oxoacid:acceptor oxidoreductase family protein [Rhodoferax sp. 4810]|uniref:2-oxoacid:acceptor oxidoreductase family protein n=1 Tax=Thiospirillum jenense TaxID=1653858 RepID=A0A839HD21_9GAMM|nr:2-oxoacid:acceptor oxidoreductase family protein [Thiospirillum jenense]MBB1073552.1 2-oxoacid:acceptor oxidoreductase family protein [Rhodoferax jenense]MBB1126040.1 2-oxoacid:acceptor oxidoreductase family protein [Thiospirillum jenense]
MHITNIIIAGLGGQGVITASDMLADAAFRAGFDVKKSELHGMSQRGGSVTSDVRFGDKILSPMVPFGEADVLLVLEETQVELNRPCLRNGGVLLTPDCIAPGVLKNKKSLNVAMLGCLSVVLDIPKAHWLDAVHAHLAEKLHRLNDEAFAVGRHATTS